MLWSGAVLISAAWATAPPPELPDDGLLEFLGSVDSEDKDWHDYLARTDIDQVARHAGDGKDPPAANAPPRANPSDPKPTDPKPTDPKPTDPPADSGSRVTPP